MPTTILASRFNTLVQELQSVLGNSSVVTPQIGYGNSYNAATVTGSRNQIDLSVVDKVTEEAFTNLYIDLVRCRVHQIGAAAFTIDPFVVGDYLTNGVSTDKIEESYIVALESLMSTIETDKFEIDIATQADIDNLKNSSGNPITSTRAESLRGPWNGTIAHIFSVSFGSAQQRRHFFNAGGEIRFSASNAYTGSQSKSINWKNLLSGMGVITFKADSSYSNNAVGSGSSVGNYSVNSSYQLIYRNSGTSPYSGNYYEVYARNVSDTELQFRVWFRDIDPESFPQIDEDVFGDLESKIELAIPDGTVNINGTDYDTVVFSGTITGTQTTLLSDF